MQIDVLTLFPEMFAPLTQSLIGKAVEDGLLDLNLINFRQYTHDKHQHVDDTPYGGGAGMLLKPDPLFEAMDAVNAQDSGPKRVILLDPAGKQFNQLPPMIWHMSNTWSLFVGIMKGTMSVSGRS